MDWRIPASTFGLIIVAELGDKAQSAAIAVAAESKSPLALFSGAILAPALLTLIGVAIRGTLSRFIPAPHIRNGAAALFLLVGALMLICEGWISLLSSVPGFPYPR